MPEIYDDCIRHFMRAEASLPRWYLLEKNREIIGCCGLVPNDFISRMDLQPWLCALFIAEKHRGHNHAMLLINAAKKDTASMGMDTLYLSTDHVGYYEKQGFYYIGQGYHPWGDESCIYGISP